MASILRTFSLATRAFTSSTMGVAAMAAPRTFLVNPFAQVSSIVQQTRGMKVHSSVKKRCEHCKVRFIYLSVDRIRSMLTEIAAGCSTKGRKAT